MNLLFLLLNLAILADDWPEARPVADVTLAAHDVVEIAGELAA